MTDQHCIDTCVGPLAVEVRGSGPPVFLWHSLFVDRRQWDPILDAISGGRRLILVDGPAHGESGCTSRQFTLEDCSTAAFEILDALECPTVDWLGCAWGGHVGVVSARRRPERLRSLAIFNAPMHPLTGLSRLRVRLLVELYALVGPIEPLARAVAGTLLRKNPDPVHVAYVYDCVRIADRQAMTNAMRSVMLGRPSLEGELAHLRLPVLFAVGTDDALSTPAQARSQAERIPGARFEIVANSGHLTPLEASDATIELLVKWLGR